MGNEKEKEFKELYDRAWKGDDWAFTELMRKSKSLFEEEPSSSLASTGFRWCAYVGEKRWRQNRIAKEPSPQSTYRQIEREDIIDWLRGEVMRLSSEMSWQHSSQRFRYLNPVTGNRFGTQELVWIADHDSLMRLGSQLSFIWEELFGHHQLSVIRFCCYFYSENIAGVRSFVTYPDGRNIADQLWARIAYIMREGEGGDE